MNTFLTISSVKNCIQNLKSNGKTIGFVPTMGALHDGHISLVEMANKENDISVVSIFVNPLQFNNKYDLKKYPRTLDKDIKILGNISCDILFAPAVKEMYPQVKKNVYQNRKINTPSSSKSKNEKLVFKIGTLDKVMEGKYRPGHFAGVCLVVKKFFDILMPDKAYFGEKDFQQLVIIKHMVNTLNIPVEIISCPTVREQDGLAMSSRNTLLTIKERRNASYIFNTLCEAKERKRKYSVSDLKKWVTEKINQNSLFQLEYFEIVNSETLQPLSSWNEAKNIRACIAAKLGAVRLIDNIMM